MKQLEPIRFNTVWGYENWIASTHADGIQPEFAGIVGTYPILVKVIQADERLSVQVHPDDETAERIEGSGARGKTECWYVLSADPGAHLVCGLSRECSREEIAAAIKNGTLEQLLRYIEVKKGDLIFIPAGTVHAIGGGMRLLEVQQCCNITYRLYDWGRPRELHVEKGLASLNVSRNACPESLVPFSESFSCDYFSLIKKSLRGGYSYLHGRNEKRGSGSDFELLFVAEGSFSVRSVAADGTKSVFSAGGEDVFVVAPGEKVTLEGIGEVIRIRPN